MSIDSTHDPARRSWVASANDGHTGFPVQNLPHGVFRRRGTNEAWRGGIAIGDCIVDLAAVQARGAWPVGMAPLARQATSAAAADQLNDLMALGRPAWRALRGVLSDALTEGAREATIWADCLVPQVDAEMALPARIALGALLR